MNSIEYLLVEKAECLSQFFLQGVFVDGVGDGVNKRAELLELELARAIGVELGEQLSQLFLIEILLHVSHDLADLCRIDEALFSAIVHIKEPFVL